MLTEAKKPFYQSVFQEMRQLILDGHYEAGDLLPSEKDLCERYGITRPTVRQALQELVNEGYNPQTSRQGQHCARPHQGPAHPLVTGCV
ncbi:MAG: GntR family transcriptional regulator [Cytophagales bacterium]|nr:GntR family transcriptional regulator [Cytophagales bacterium]